MAIHRYQEKNYRRGAHAAATVSNSVKRRSIEIVLRLPA
jgi:hypothetical protein